MIPPQLTGSPAGEVLGILQRHGPVTIKDLETGLGVTTTAVRQQIAGLLADGYIQQEIERAGRGRPRHVYSLTPKGRSLFPHHYDEFTNSLLREILVSEGPAKVQELLGRMGQRMAAQYESQLAGLSSNERATKLTELLNAKGILTEVKFEPDGIVFQANREEHHQWQLYRFDIGTRMVTRLSSREGSYDSPVLSKDGSFIVASFSTFNSPDELVRVPTHTSPASPTAAVATNGALAFSGESLLTNSVPEEFRRVSWVTPEIVHFKARDGETVPAMIYRPAVIDSAKRYPVVVFVHGAGRVSAANTPSTMSSM